MHPMNHASTAGSHSRAIALYAIAILVVAGTATAFVQSYEGLVRREVLLVEWR